MLGVFLFGAITRLVMRVRPGDKYGRLTVISLSHSAKRADGAAGERTFDCRCECGNTIKSRSSNLKSGNTQSCGCLKRERTQLSNKNRDNIESIEDHMGYACQCGSVNFVLLKSGKIECSSCLSVIQGFKWSQAHNKEQSK